MIAHTLATTEWAALVLVMGWHGRNWWSEIGIRRFLRAQAAYQRVCEGRRIIARARRLEGGSWTVYADDDVTALALLHRRARGIQPLPAWGVGS